MARKKIRISRRRRFSFGGRRRKSGEKGGILHMDAMLYGAARKPIADAILNSPIGSYLNFAGQYKDELAMGVLSLAVSKFGGGGLISSVGKKGLIVENSRIGEGIAQSGLNLTQTSHTQSNGGYGNSTW